MRKTFTKIILQQHPDSSNYNITTTNLLNEPDELDYIILKKMRLFLDNSKLNNSDGEWKYIDENKRKNYINSLKNGELLIFVNMFRNDSIYGVVTPFYKEIKNVDDFISQVLLDLDTCEEFCYNFNIDDCLVSQNIGNPFGLLINDKILMPDTPRHYYYSEKINKLNINNNYILEIGGGYGGLALMLNKLHNNCILVDLYESCLLQYYFLNKNGVNVQFINDINDDLLENYNYIVPNNLFEKFILNKNLNIDLVFNSRSFSEMDKNTLNFYLNFIQKEISPKYIYHENSNFLLFPNSIRHIETISNEFNINQDYDRINMSISPFLGGDGRYREYLYKKK